MEQMQNRKSRPGPKPDPGKASLRASFTDWSPRTFETWWKGFKIGNDLVADGVITHTDKVEIAESIIKRIIRPNGTFSVARYLASWQGVDTMLREYDHGHDEAPTPVEEQGPDVCGSPSATSTMEEHS